MLTDFYRGRRVLVTGHSGFKGGWLCCWLKELGAQVCGYALKPKTAPSLHAALKVSSWLDGEYFGDIRDEKALGQAFLSFKPELIFHLAAQPLVKRSFTEPLITYETNVIGTLKVLLAARDTPSVRALVAITSDKCYENDDSGRPIDEQQPMGGYDPYSSSKGCAELLLSSFRRSYLGDAGAFKLASARAGNVIGGGDWSEDRLVPDCVRAFESGEAVVLRHPKAQRPWQHVLEPLRGYLVLGQALLEGREECTSGFNFGPSPQCQYSVGELCDLLRECYGKGEIREVESYEFHEAAALTLAIDKAAAVLGWYPCLEVRQALQYTADWYRHFYADKVDMHAYTKEQIRAYTHRAAQQAG